MLTTNQTLYDSTTEEFSCATLGTANSHATQGTPSSQSSGSLLASRSGSGSAPCSGDLTVTVPDCRWQVDLILGQPRNPPTGYPAGTVLTWRFGGEGECPTATSSTTTTSTSTTSTTAAPPTTSTSTLISDGTSTTLAGPASTTTTLLVLGTPTELAQSGGGELTARALAALGLIGAGGLAVWRGRRLGQEGADESGW